MGDTPSLTRLYSQMFTEYPDVVGVPQMCSMLGGISTKTGYRLLKDNKIRSIKIGREYRIPKAYVLEYLTIADPQELCGGESEK